MADIKKTLGGDRIGAGKKMQVELDGYIRSNFDLSMVNRFSQAPGTIIPCYCNIGQKGDTWNFDLSALVRTKPTTGPLYGSFKFEVLFFAADIRLYNGALHNNALNLGLNMQNVVYPKVSIPIKANAAANTGDGSSISWAIQRQNMNPSALMAYLGVTNPGSSQGNANPSQIFQRYFNGMPLLMYWDVVKNYFLNKQEDNAWYIAPQVKTIQGPSVKFTRNITSATQSSAEAQKQLAITNGTSGTNFIGSVYATPPETTFTMQISANTTTEIDILEVKCTNETYTTNRTKAGEVKLLVVGTNNQEYELAAGSLSGDSGWNSQGTIWHFVPTLDIINNTNITTPIKHTSGNSTFIIIKKVLIPQASSVETTTTELTSMGLTSFPATNLDKARGVVLKNFFEGENVMIQRGGSGNNIINFPPYTAVCEIDDTSSKLHNSFSQNGIAIKTYSNDIFNAFLNSETIQQINQQTAASITNGQLNISNLILAEKIYKLQNKIAVAGGTYEDWQEAVYGVPTAPANESPRFIGGMTSEIVFDEVVASSATEVGGEVSPLGALGGRGSLNGQKGGKFELEVKEDCIIMGLCCITPRVDYSQGNKWFFNLENNDQLHKPELDRIGFQELIGEWMVGADTNVSGSDTTGTQHSYAMQPAWEHYMTAVNEAHGDFADENQAMYMTLNRRYEITAGSDGNMIIKDFTSYIDPTKYNYAFADTTIESQNFWTQIGMDIKVRRVMSSKVMPNL